MNETTKPENKKNKQRLDALLVERCFFSGRDQAKAAIMAGEVLVNEQKLDKPGTNVPLDAEIRLLGCRLPYVSRGGFKLARAIDSFMLDLTGAVVLDIGSSTGGFVDCALQNGASRVYSVDVGYGQLAWKLRNDDRVVVMEKTNARYLKEGAIPEQVDFITVDASFISLLKILPAPLAFLKERGFLVALLKPQFEAGRDKVGKKGVVRDKKTHQDVILNTCGAMNNLSMQVLAIDYSPVTGPEGNIEFLLLAKKELPGLIKNTNTFSQKRVEELVESAWSSLYAEKLD